MLIERVLVNALKYTRKVNKKETMVRSILPAKYQ